LDIFVRPTPDNASRVLDSLNQFGFGDIGLKHEGFARADAVIQLGVPPVRIVIIASISGVLWDEANLGRVEGAYGDVSAGFLGREQPIVDNRASGREKDLADLEALGE
jgi:hypothetical protein